MWTILLHWLGWRWAEMTPGRPLYYHPVIPNTRPSSARCAQGSHLTGEMRAPEAKSSASSAPGMQEAESHCMVTLSRKRSNATPSHPGNAKTHRARPKVCTYPWLMNPGPVTFIIKDGELAQIPHNHLMFLNGPDIHVTQELRRQRS